MKHAARLKLLFVCSRNRRRSLTAEKLLEGSQRYDARSVGTQPGARILVTEGHLGWADLIFCMEKSHLQRLRQRFPETLAEKQIISLQVRDEYEYLQPELIEELYAQLSAYLELPAEE